MTYYRYPPCRKQQENYHLRSPCCKSGSMRFVCDSSPFKVCDPQQMFVILSRCMCPPLHVAEESSCLTWSKNKACLLWSSFTFCPCRSTKRYHMRYERTQMTMAPAEKPIRIITFETQKNESLMINNCHFSSIWNKWNWCSGSLGLLANDIV